MKIHPDAATFPLMSEAEFDALALDIAAHGLRETIKTDHTGELLVDGRNRERACGLAGVEPRYERLLPGTDIFAYIISVNLHRRHLSDEQRLDVIRQVKERNPTLSNREIARIANVSHPTVAIALSGPTGRGLPVGQRTTGGDGKSRPASGRYNEEEKADLMVKIQQNPTMRGRDLAELLNISHGTVQRYRRELAGEPAPRLGRPSTRREVSLDRPILKALSPEETGRPVGDERFEQDPDSPPGVTRVLAHIAKHGRVQPFSLDEMAQQRLYERMMSFNALLRPVVKVEEPPTYGDLDKLDTRRRNTVLAFWRQHRAALYAILDASIGRAEEAAPKAKASG